ncbi:MAG: hypothetical protein ACHQF0_12215 [Chitinophagales bacterium]
MKTKIRNYGTIALLVAFGLMATATRANDGKGEKPAAELKYIGNINNQPVFQLDLTSSLEKDFTIAIKDVYGNILYSERVKAKNFTRKYQLDTDQIDDEVLKVEVISGKKTKPEVFTITRNTRFIEEPSISKL